MLTEKEVKRVAELARIGLTDEELKKFEGQLTTILDFINELQKLKTDKVKPLSQTTGLKNVFRQDLVLPSLSQKDVLANAPKTHQGYFKTKPVFDA